MMNGCEKRQVFDVFYLIVNLINVKISELSQKHGYLKCFTYLLKNV